MRDPASTDPVSAAMSILWQRRCGPIAALALVLFGGPALAQQPAPVFTPSYIADTRDMAGHFKGGTEIRTLAGNLVFSTYLVRDAAWTFNRTGPDSEVHRAEDIHAMTLANLHGEFATAVTAEVLLQTAGRGRRAGSG